MQAGNAVWNALPAMYYQREPESSLTSEFNQAKSSIISLQSLQLMKPIEISDTDFLEMTKAKKKKNWFI